MSRLTFDPEAHEYRVDGEVYPSVTQIIRAGSEEDKYADIPEHILKRAAEKGNLTHEAIEKYHTQNAPLISEDEQVNAYLQGYAQFLQSDMFDWMSSEHRLFCECHRYAGTVDLIGKINGKWSVLDIKTTSKLDEEYVGVQTAAYKHLWNQDNPSVERRYVVWLKPGDYELVHLDDPLHWIMFKKAVEEYYDNTKGDNND